MIELDFIGPKFTWSHGNSVDTRRLARLDRALCDEEWRKKFPEAFVTHCAHGYSDHSPILLQLRSNVADRIGDRPFRFQAAWLTHRQFMEFIRREWPTEGSMKQRLEDLGGSLKLWNRDVFGHIKQRKDRLRARLAGVQRVLSQFTSTAMLKLEQRLKRQWEEVLTQEEILWHQKSRVQWLQAGDRNTQFFHLSTLIRRRRNKVEAIQNEVGEWITDQLALKNLFVDYFQKLYAADHQPRGTFITGKFPLLTAPVFGKLSSRYTKEEVLCALKAMGPLKAPGPDGFPAIFYQQAWEIVGNDISKDTIRLLEGGDLHPGLAEALMVLIPKGDHPESVKNFAQSVYVTSPSSWRLK